MENGLFIFRRDLRIIDNKGLNHLQTKCKNIFTIFIFTPEQVVSNEFRSENAILFMMESLSDLEEKIREKGGKLLFFYGDNETVIRKCITALKIDIICFNMDCTPYSVKRDEDIKKIGVPVETGGDYYLNWLGSIKTGTKTIYKKFTPYYNTAVKHEVEDPHTSTIRFSKAEPSFSLSLLSIIKKLKIKENKNRVVFGGRDNALQCLIRAKKEQANYSETHNELSKNTSQLSAFIKFGCLSVREVYKEFKDNKDFIRQLYWRDFYANIMYAYPEVLKEAMKPTYRTIKWTNNPKWFQAWTEGKTGFPVVDAGMRELNATGYMHNRARLITASFLIKTLLINWQEGEKYFAKHLTDYDPASNNLNWQWCASSAVDSQPYFRIFNPWLQSKTYDEEAEYIKKWIPELESVLAKDIHTWFKTYEKYAEATHYPGPIVSYEEQKEKALKMYKEIE